ncbi:MAG TPA: RIP metalloprotease RseP [Bauldia sp.]
MGLASWFGNFGSTAVGYVVPFLFVLTIVVFFHELGHFLVARWCGVAVKTFSIGFGPELIGFTDRTGTRWRISAIPLGGYVRFLGDGSEMSNTDREAIAAMPVAERMRTFAGKGVGARAAIVAAGPIANFILAVVIFAGIFSIVGQQTVTPRVDTVIAGSPAEKAGVQAGDIVVSVNGSAISSFTDLQRIVGFASGEALTLVLKRGDADVTVTATPERKEVTDSFGNKQRLGVLGISRDQKSTDVVTQRYSVPAAAWAGIKETWFITDHTLGYLFGVATGRESADQLGGPIRVAEVSAQVATLGFVALLNLAAILSVSIGLINLFPVPMLDGGHLLYFAFEAARGRPLSERVQDIGFRIGLAAVLMLMIFATWNDIIHLSLL